MRAPDEPGVVVVAGVSLVPYEQTRRVALDRVARLRCGAHRAGGARRPLDAARGAAPGGADDRGRGGLERARPGRRFAAGEPYDELSQLAATLDGLLDDLSASLLREQRFSAEVSHELRTPLARVRTEAELALRRERPSADYRAALQAIIGNARHMSRSSTRSSPPRSRRAAWGAVAPTSRPVLARLADECGQGRQHAACAWRRVRPKGR